MISQGFFTYKSNIFDQVPPLLDPRIEHNGLQPVLTLAKYEEQRRLAMEDLKTYRARSHQAANVASSSGSGANTPTATTASTSALQTAAASSPAASSPGTTPQASSQASPRPLPPSQTQNMARPPPNNATARPPARPPISKPDDLMSVIELQRALSIKDLKARGNYLSAVSHKPYTPL